MSKIAFICVENLKGLFEGLGVDSFILKERHEVKIILEDIVKKDYHIVYILEKLAVGFLDLIDEIRTEEMVSIIIVPDHVSSLNLSTVLTRRAMVDAIGTEAEFAGGERQ